MLPPDPSEADRLELAVLQRLVLDLPVPSRDLPGWESLTSREYAEAVRELEVLLAAIADALARAAG